MSLSSRLLQKRDQVGSVLGLLEPSEHLSTRGPASSALPFSAVHREKSSTGGEWQKQTQNRARRSSRSYAAQHARQPAEPSGRAEEGVSTILVPGMYAFGLSRYMYRCSSHHVMPVAKRR